MEEFTYEEMLEEIAESLKRPDIDRDAGEFTIEDMMRLVVLPRSTLERRLDEQEREGTLTKRKIYHKGRWIKAYKLMTRTKKSAQET